MERRLEDQIRDLFAKIVATDDIGEVQTLSAQLQAAISEHINRLREKVVGYPVATERRSSTKG